MFKSARSSSKRKESILKSDGTGAALPGERMKVSPWNRLWLHVDDHRNELFQVFRYVLCGVWNTLFGFAVYALAYRLFGHTVHYLLLLIPVNVLALTNAFLCYKYIVFRTRGDGWREYFTCYLVYGWAMALSAILLFVLVKGLGLHPILGNGFCVLTTTVISYMGHKRFSFRVH